MAEILGEDATHFNEDVRKLVWGSSVEAEVFERWSQGFTLSPTEPTALVQHQGGPCAVIAPVQGYLLKKILFDGNPVNDLKTVSASDMENYLTETLLEVLKSVSTGSITIVTRGGQPQSNSHKNTTAESNTPSMPVSGTKPVATSDTTGESTSASLAKKIREDIDLFHSTLRCHKCANTPEQSNKLKPVLATYFDQYGIILFMYSVIISKGIDEIISEMQEPGEALVDGVHGHGTQNLINLFLTGCAVSNVWDNDREVCGLNLRGVTQQSLVGFLSYLEHLRYCEVGWYLKNPKFPIWLLASETHLTVLFSKERGIVFEESKEQTARRVFKTFDTESNGFVQSEILGELMAALDLVSEREYVNMMRERLDQENLGIITLNSFLNEFFPDDPIVDTPKSFVVYHYNGLPQSSPNGQLHYQEAEVTLEDEPDVQIITDTSPIKLCLQTKWPSIDLRWSQSSIPSIY